jgi:MYXO-CTERM domain-containing protein
MDCPTGEGCAVDGSGKGACVAGADPGDAIGSLCQADKDCQTGLCEKGVCTVTCDFDAGSCRLGYTCDQNAVPGGLCVPDSCHNQHTGFCGDFNCSYSPEEHYVCAKGPSNFSCSDLAVTRSSTPAFGVLALGAMAALLVSRRRRTTAA